MGKKDKKKGKGAEKTASKTDKKLSQKLKKELAVKGEDEIEKIVAQIEEEERKRKEVIIKVVSPPSCRSNFSFTAHPEKDELILFGGEYFNGQKTLLYNELFLYNIGRAEWTLVKAPGGPPPRCSHQAVALSSGKGQLWVFGGEYASPTQSQFYHYRDLWVFHFATNLWEKISAAGAPSSRSGHRMVCVKKQLIVFGGFHDNLRDYKYFNDVHIFNLETRTWTKLEPTGTPPAPRSACQMVPTPDGKVLVFGGYSKVKIKKDVDKGTIHMDAFLLTPDKNDTSGLKWKWSQVKPGGSKYSPRCGVALTSAPGGKGYTFGGVFDIDNEDEEDIDGSFYNDLHCLELEKLVFRTVSLSGKKEGVKPKRRRRMKDNGEEGEDSEEDIETEEMEKAEPVVQTLADDGVFKVTVGGDGIQIQRLLDLPTTLETADHPHSHPHSQQRIVHGPPMATPVSSKMAHQPPRHPPTLESRHLSRQHYPGHNGSTTRRAPAPPRPSVTPPALPRTPDPPLHSDHSGTSLHDLVKDQVVVSSPRHSIASNNSSNPSTPPSPGHDHGSSSYDS